MGNRHSAPIEEKKKRTVYDILEITESMSKEEIKKQYTRMLLKNHPDRNKDGTDENIIEIREAYKLLEANNFKKIIEKEKKLKIIDISIYDKKYWSNLNEQHFFKEANLLFDGIIDNENVFVEKVMPRFGDLESKKFPNFYLFYENFKTEIKFTSNYSYVRGKDKRYFEKIYDKGEKQRYNSSIRNLAKILQSLDPRYKKKTVFEKSVDIKITKKEEKTTKNKIKKQAEQYQFYCDACLKGFMSVNTMRTHLNTKKHKGKLIEMNMEDIDIENLLSSFEESKDQSFNNEEFEETETENQKNDENEKTNFSLDSELENLNIKVIKDEALNNPKKTTKNKNLNHTNKGCKKSVRKKNVQSITDSEQLLKCSHCNMIFDSRNKLFAHLRADHS